MSHTSKKCRKIWQFIGIFMLTCVVSVLPASLAGAQRVTKSTVAQMEKEVGRLELDIPIETSRVGWTYVPILNIYPSNTTGLNTSKPISYANRKTSEGKQEKAGKALPKVSEDKVR